jgi:hypothetical protein
MREESPNGGAERWLAGGKGTVASHLSVGEKAAKRGKLQPPSAFIDGGERRGDCGPARRRQGTGGLPVRRQHGARWFPLSWVSDGWASVGFLNSGMSQKGIRASLFMAQLVNNYFSFFPHRNKFENYENPTFIALKFTKLCNLIE